MTECDIFTSEQQGPRPDQQPLALRSVYFQRVQMDFLELLPSVIDPQHDGGGSLTPAGRASIPTPLLPTHHY